MGRRIRAIKPEFWENEDVQSLDREARFTLIGLWMYVDDYGRGSGNPALIRSAVYPLDDISNDVIERHLTELDDAGLIKIYDVGRRTYVWITDWFYWQRVDKPTDSRLPGHPEDVYTGLTVDGVREEVNSSRAVREPLVGEGRGGESARGREREPREREGESESWGERESERGGTSRPALEGDLTPPSPFCSKHPAGTEKPCRPCGTARNAFEYWQAQRQAELDE
ncbi:hypothetical protein ACFWGP_05585 [Agromyces sp. NPDC127015]|uniref:hypothetical protein n=1 Tax=Agromyces sp. NPDC127015 TaxID=3347108 RepID=UPI00366888DF